MFLSEISGPRWVIMGIVVKLAQSVRSFPHFNGTFLIIGTNSLMSSNSGWSPSVIALPC